MQSAIVEEFGAAILIDNALFAQQSALGEAITSAEMIELSASSRALYNLCILTGRELEHLRECHKLWQAAAEVFEQMLKAWKNVEGDDYARGHISLLSRLCLLSQDRAALYNVTRSERDSFARRKAIPARTPAQEESV
jgi:hypothetical protein